MMTAVIALVSSLSFFVTTAQAENKPRARAAGQATASLQDNERPNPNAQGVRRTEEASSQSEGQEAGDLKDIADSLARIDKGLKQKGQQGINVGNAAAELNDENALRVADPLLRDINNQLNNVDTTNQQYRPIQPQDTRRNLASIKAQLATYETRLQRALTTSSATASPTPTATPEAGWGASLWGLGQVALAALSLLGLGLGAAALLLFLRMRGNLAQLRHDVRKVATAVSKTQLPGAPAQATAPPPARAAADASDGTTEQLSKQLRDQQQAIALLTQQIGTLENRAAAGEKRTTDSVQAVEQVTRWLTRMHIRGAEGDVFDDESERAAALASLERHNERLSANAHIVEPLTQSIASLMETLEARPGVSPELLARVQRLYHEIGQFDQWAVTSEAQLNALRRGSMDERRVKFQSEQRQLGEQLKANRITFAQYIDQFSRMLEHHFPHGASDGAAQSPVAQLSDEQLRQYVEGAPEYLMDWFSSFSQLQSQAQAAQATGAGVDAETIDALATVQRVARDVLSRFDIQPEEIYVGRTNYDRHLHEAAMIRQTTQFPVNTVIEVHRAGFRRVSTGEVLRRPQVIVAGAGA